MVIVTVPDPVIPSVIVYDDAIGTNIASSVISTARAAGGIVGTVLFSNVVPAVPVHLENAYPAPAAAENPTVAPDSAVIEYVPAPYVYCAPATVIVTVPVPVTVNDTSYDESAGTKYTVAARLPDAFVDTLLPMECKDAAELTHLENVYPSVPVAVIDIAVPEAIGIVVFSVIEYAAPFIVRATEPVPLMFAVNV